MSHWLPVREQRCITLQLTAVLLPLVACVFTLKHSVCSVFPTCLLCLLSALLSYTKLLGLSVLKVVIIIQFKKIFVYTAFPPLCMKEMVSISKVMDMHRSIKRCLKYTCSLKHKMGRGILLILSQLIERLNICPRCFISPNEDCEQTNNSEKIQTVSRAASYHCIQKRLQSNSVTVDPVALWTLTSSQAVCISLTTHSWFRMSSVSAAWSIILINIYINHIFTYSVRCTVHFSIVRFQELLMMHVPRACRPSCFTHEMEICS